VFFILRTDDLKKTRGVMRWAEDWERSLMTKIGDLDHNQPTVHDDMHVPLGRGGCCGKELVSRVLVHL